MGREIVIEPMKTIATINFKGGVGKTTITWALANVVAQDPKRTLLMCDLNAPATRGRKQPERHVEDAQGSRHSIDRLSISGEKAAQSTDANIG